MWFSPWYTEAGPSPLFTLEARKSNLQTFSLGLCLYIGCEKTDEWYGNAIANPWYFHMDNMKKPGLCYIWQKHADHKRCSYIFKCKHGKRRTYLKYCIMFDYRIHNTKVIKGKSQMTIHGGNGWAVCRSYFTCSLAPNLVNKESITLKLRLKICGYKEWKLIMKIKYEK